jgi:hypothetical protein
VVGTRPISFLSYCALIVQYLDIASTSPLQPRENKCDSKGLWTSATELPVRSLGAGAANCRAHPYLVKGCGCILSPWGLPSAWLSRW